MVLSLWPVVAAGKAKGKSDGRKDQTTSGHTGEERRGGVWGGSKSSGGMGKWLVGRCFHYTVLYPRPTCCRYQMNISMG